MRRLQEGQFIKICVKDVKLHLYSYFSLLILVICEQSEMVTVTANSVITPWSDDIAASTVGEALP